MPVYTYRPAVLEALLGHGVRPLPTTPPSLLREYLNDLYRYELRQLRSRLIAGEFPKREYASRVIALRARYPLLSLPTSAWTIRADDVQA